MINNTIKISITALLLGTQLQAGDYTVSKTEHIDQPSQLAFPERTDDYSYLKGFLSDFTRLRLEHTDHITSDDAFNWLKEFGFLKLLPKDRKIDDYSRKLFHTILITRTETLMDIAKFLRDNDFLTTIRNRPQLTATIIYLKTISELDLTTLKKLATETINKNKEEANKAPLSFTDIIKKLDPSFSVGKCIESIKA